MTSVRSISSRFVAFIALYREASIEGDRLRAHVRRVIAFCDSTGLESDINCFKLYEVG